MNIACLTVRLGDVCATLVKTSNVEYVLPQILGATKNNRLPPDHTKLEKAGNNPL